MLRSSSSRSVLAPVLPLLLALLAAPAAAQSGPLPFFDGELLVRGPGAVSGYEALYRIDPAAGHGELLIDSLYPNYSKAGWMAYDPFRDLVLAYTAYQPLGVFSPRLYGIGADGSLASLGFDGEKLAALTPLGDGRVYCTRDQKPYLLDAGDNLLPLLDAGGLPVDLSLDHLAYDAASNSLIGVTTSIATSPCYAPFHLAVHRLPLDAAGTKLAGPVACSSFDINAAAYAVGLDPLPGGDLLVSLTGVSPLSDLVLLRVEPDTLNVTVWSVSTLNDLNGGVWSPKLARAVVLDDTANVLRTFIEGQGGTGTLLTVDVPVGDGSTGVSPTNTMTDVDLLGAACGGLAQTFGAGLAGKGGFVPSLGASLCPTLGSPLKLAAADGVGGGLGLVVIATATAPYPLFGGTGYVLPPFVAQLPLVLGGSAGLAGAGGAVLSIPTPSTPSLLGVPFYAQAGILDAAAAQGVSFTKALELRLG